MVMTQVTMSVSSVCVCKVCEDAELKGFPDSIRDSYYFSEVVTRLKSKGKQSNFLRDC